jgi:hypothetical protein
MLLANGSVKIVTVASNTHSTIEEPLSPSQTLMMGTEMVPEISVIFNQSTWLSARQDFIT